MTRPRSRRDGGPSRTGFTLIEMILVILVILILAGLTVAVVGRTVDGDRVRGGARQVQNYLAGARDRAIYAASRLEDATTIPPAIGVRFLPDPAMTIPDADPSTPGDQPAYRAFGSMVFVQEVDPLPTRLTVYQEEDPAGSGIYVWRASQFAEGSSGLESFGQSSGEFPLRAAGNLILRGLIPGRREGGVPTFYLPVYFDRDSSKEAYFIRFTLNDLRQDGNPNPPNPSNLQTLASGTWWLFEGTLSKPYFDSASDAYTPQMCRFRVLPSVMPSEEPRYLPRGCVVDVQSSSIGGAIGGLADSLRMDGSFDIMFNSRGIVEGPLAAVGQVHLVVADNEDVERGFRIGSAFVNADGTPYTSTTGSPAPADADGDGNPDERRGEEFIVSVRTQTGSIYSSDVSPVADGSQIPPDTNGPYLRDYPFWYADGGGEAR